MIKLGDFGIAKVGTEAYSMFDRGPLSLSLSLSQPAICFTQLRGSYCHRIINCVFLDPGTEVSSSFVLFRPLSYNRVNRVAANLTTFLVPMGARKHRGAGPDGDRGRLRAPCAGC